MPSQLVPNNFAGVENWTFNASSFVIPILVTADLGYASKAYPNPARHRSFQRYLTLHLMRFGDLGDSFHHGLGPAAYNPGFGEIRFLLQKIFQHRRDALRWTNRTISVAICTFAPAF